MGLKRTVRRHPAVSTGLAAVIVVALVFGLYWFQPWKLWTNTTVNDEIPVAAAMVGPGTLPPAAPAAVTVIPPSPTGRTTPAPSTGPSPKPAATTPAVSHPGPPVKSTPAGSALTAPTSTAPTSRPKPVTTAPVTTAPVTTAPVTTAPVTTAPVSTPVATNPAAGPVDLLRGSLISHEHPTSGTVRVIALPDGRRVLALENLSTSDGPDVHVWLAAAPVIAGEAGWYVFDDGAYRDLGSLKGNLGNQVYPIPADVDLAALPNVTLWCERFAVSFGAAELA